MTAISAERGLVRSLYDFSFTSFVTTRLVRALYVTSTLVSSLGATVLFVFLVSRGGYDLILGLVAVPLLYVLGLVFTRVMLEFVCVVFRIAEHARDLRGELRAAVAGRWNAPQQTQ